MSSEAAQKAYPDRLPMTETNRHRAAFDAGAVEALRQAAWQVDTGSPEWVRLTSMADWWAGQ